MKIDLGNILKGLGWPLGLIAVFSAVMALFGVDLDTVLVIAGSMLGAQALIVLLIDVLKWAGAIRDGTAGKWSAGLNLLLVIAVAVAQAFNPAFDFPKLDTQLVIIAQFATLLFGYIVQVAGSKNMHRAFAQGLGVEAFSYTRG